MLVLFARLVRLITEAVQLRYRSGTNEWSMNGEWSRELRGQLVQSRFVYQILYQPFTPICYGGSAGLLMAPQ